MLCLQIFPGLAPIAFQYLSGAAASSMWVDRACGSVCVFDDLTYKAPTPVTTSRSAIIDQQSRAHVAAGYGSPWNKDGAFIADPFWKRFRADLVTNRAPLRTEPRTRTRTNGPGGHANRSAAGPYRYPCGGKLFAPFVVCARARACYFSPRAAPSI